MPNICVNKLQSIFYVLIQFLPFEYYVHKYLYNWLLRVNGRKLPLYSIRWGFFLSSFEHNIKDY